MYFRRQHGNVWKGVQTPLSSPGSSKQCHQENVCFVGTMFLQHVQSSAYSRTTFCVQFDLEHTIIIVQGNVNHQREAGLHLHVQG